MISSWTATAMSIGFESRMRKPACLQQAGSLKRLEDKSENFELKADKSKTARYNNGGSYYIVRAVHLVRERRIFVPEEWGSTKKAPPERRTYTVDDIAQILGIGRSSAYLLVKEGHFRIVRIGNAIRISKRSFDEWLDSLDL